MQTRLYIEPLEARAQLSVIMNPSPGVYACVVGDLPDETAELQTVVQSAPPRSTIDLEGDLPLTAMIDLTFGVGKNGLPGLAPGFTFQSVGGANVHGNIDGLPLVGRNLQGLTSTASEIFENIQFHNFSPRGIDLQLEYLQDVTLEHCRFLIGGAQPQQPGDLAEGFIIGAVTRTNTDIRVRDCTFLGNLATCPHSIGADISAGRCDFYSVAGYQFERALVVGGLVNVWGGHFEEDWIGIQTGNRGRMYQGVVQGVDFEGMGYSAIICTKSTASLTLDSINVNGDKFQGQTYPTYAIDLQRGSGAVFMSNVFAGGNFSQSVIHLAGNGPVYCLLVFPGNRGLAGSTLTWDVQMDPALLTRIDCGT